MEPSCKAGGEGDTHSGVEKPEFICTNLMGRNFLGCPRRAHDEVNVSHELVIEHQRVPASEGRGRSPVSLAGSPRPGPQAGTRPPPCPPPPLPAGPSRLPRPQVQGAGPGTSPARPGPGPHLSRRVGWKDCQLALSKLLLLRFWSWGGGGGWALCWSCRAFFLLLAAAALLFAMLVLVLAG